MAVIDAGSTGTRLHIYAFDRNEYNEPVNIKELWINKIKPGLATIGPSKDNVSAYMDRLFKKAPHEKVPVYFYATAGMRLLPKTLQSQYFQSLTDWFNKKNEWPLKDIRTISGSEEALFGWLSVNQDLGHFGVKESSYVGVLDMGGASVQIAFPVTKTNDIDPDDLMEVKVRGKQVKLFVHSFLGLGKTVFAYQFLDTKSCFPDGYKLPNGLVGKGDAKTCQLLITKLINTVHEVNETTQPVLAQNATKDWYVLGGILHLVKDSPFKFNNHQFNSEALLEQGNQQVCNKLWSEIARSNPNHEDIHNYCLFPSYYYALLVNGYGINPEAPVHIPVDANRADWTLGVVLHLT